MKRFSIIALLSLILISCESILDIEQDTKITTATAWNTEAAALSNVEGIYYRMRSAFQEGFVYWGEYRNGLWGGGRRNGANQAMSAIITNRLNSTLGMANWNGLYNTINQANLSIKYLPTVNFMNEQTKNDALAGAYFVRAFSYYWIARLWGDAPLELVPYESMEGMQYSDRTSTADLFRQVEEDIEKARSLISPSAQSKTRASYAAIEMLATDYYLWKYKVLNGSSADLQKASESNVNVLGLSNYLLEPVFADVFVKETTEREVIFKWPYIQSEFEKGYPYDFLFATNNVTNVEWRDKEIPVSPDPQWTNITLEYADYLYQVTSDQRAATSYGIFDNFGWVNKFVGNVYSSERVYDSDINVYRLADAILFEAEIKLAQNQIQGAVDALNKIAERAYGVTDYYSLTDPNQIRQAILDERKKEFVAEGRTWWDFIRLGVVFEQVPSLIGRGDENNVLLWPVHNSALNSNPNIKQTLGY